MSIEICNDTIIFVFFRVHARYHFECSCEACLNDWPQCSKLPSNIKGLPPTAYKDKTAITKLVSLLKVKDKKLEKKEVATTEKVKICIDAMKLAESILKRPHALLCDIENDLHRCLYAFYCDEKS
jgi:hypothetical protein